MPIEPDNKNWTWVLERPCPECGFDSSSIGRDDIVTTFVANAAEWPALLAHPQAAVRPSDIQWSALEYGAHVADVIALYDMRLGLMIAEDGAKFVNWQPDEAAAAGRYAEQDPGEVGARIVALAGQLAARFNSVTGAMWQRRGIRSDGSAFTIETFGRYFVHDPIHHVIDVTKGYAMLGSPGGTVAP